MKYVKASGLKRVISGETNPAQFLQALQRMYDCLSPKEKATATIKFRAPLDADRNSIMFGIEHVLEN